MEESPVRPLEVSELFAGYGRALVVHGLSLSAAAGTVTLLLGPNGSGKSTTLKSIAGTIQPEAGSIRLFGEEISGSPSHRNVRRGLVLVPEGRRIIGSLTVEENLRLGAHTLSTVDCSRNLNEMFDRFPVLRSHRKLHAGLLSGGQQQILAFARGLMSNPRVMLIDEPSMGLAPVMIADIFSEVRRIADSGVSVVIVEQNAEAGLRIADSVLVIARGEELYNGSKAEAMAHPAVGALLPPGPLGKAAG